MNMPTIANSDAEVLTEAQYCQRYGVSPRSAQRQRVAGDGPPFCRLSARRIGYRVSDVNAWLNGRVFASRAAELAAKPPT